MLHPRIQEVTERIITRSKATRQAYLDRISHAKKQTRVRAGLGCGNIATLWLRVAPMTKRV